MQKQGKQYKKLLHKQRLMAAALIVVGILETLLDRDLTMLIFLSTIAIPILFTKNIYIQ